MKEKAGGERDGAKVNQQQQKFELKKLQLMRDTAVTASTEGASYYYQSAYFPQPIFQPSPIFPPHFPTCLLQAPSVAPRTSHCFSSSSHCIELLKRTLHLLTTPSVTSEWVLFVFLIPLHRIVRKKFAFLLEYLIHIILVRVFGKFWQVRNIWQVINNLGEFWNCNQHAFICHKETVSLVDQVINISLHCHAMFL